MKLLTHTSFFWVTMSMILFFVMGIGTYFVFKELENDRLDHDLIEQMSFVLQNPETYKKSIDTQIPFFYHAHYELIEGQVVEGYLLMDSVLSFSESYTPVPVRLINFAVEVEEETYRFTLAKSTISSDALTERLIWLFTIEALLFAAGLYLLNRHVFTRTWKGFYRAIQKVKLFEAGGKVPEFDPEEIDEFEDLNSELAKMTSRINDDFTNLQSFTSHTTHEFQTPLAVIISKTDLLLQNEGFSQNQYGQIKNIQHSAKKLSRMTQALSLLFKIDNHHYPAIEKVSFKELFAHLSHWVQEQCELNGITLETDIQEDFVFQMNPELADILLANILRNAWIHSAPGGVLRVHLTVNHVLICNSAQTGALDSKTIFTEFSKGDHSGGLGLGLAVVSKIAAATDLSVNYAYLEDFHCFKITC